MLWIGIGVLVLGLVAYWLLVVTEGTYLGARCVALLYDATATRYDDIKQLHFVDEKVYLGIPFAERLEDRPHPKVLDVAAGTARMPIALGSSLEFEGTVVAGDRAAGMLAVAREATRHLNGSLNLTRFDAQHLPFADAAFDGATCLEALEFIPDGTRALSEIRRILVPGGVALISNRVGRDALWFPGRVCGRGKLEEQLCELGFVDIERQIWQVHYDLVWARKPEAG